LTNLDVAQKVVAEGLRLHIPDECPFVFKNLMEQCWKTDPDTRPDFKEICYILDTIDGPNSAQTVSSSNQTFSSINNNNLSNQTIPSNSMSLMETKS